LGYKFTCLRRQSAKPLQQFENLDPELVSFSKLLGAEHISRGNNEEEICKEETDSDEEVDTGK